MSNYVQHRSPHAKPVVVTGTDPAAGAEISETVPDGEVWELVAIRIRLVSDATVSSRTVRLAIDDGTSTFALLPSVSGQGASETRDHTFAVGAASLTGPNSTNAHVNPLPPFVLPAGWKIGTDSINLQAGDDYAAPILCVVKASA